MKCTIRRAVNRAGFSIWFFKDDGERLWVAKPFEITFEEKPRDYAWELPEPSFSISSRAFNELKASLIEELVEAGIIDSSARETARELKATKFHLEDMRKYFLKDLPEMK